jgi:inorganic phosphate transporter, PiT family
MLLFVICIILVALVFEYINGFHDTANAIATSVGTKVLTPAQAVAIAATFDLIGALVGTAVAKTIATGLVDIAYVSLVTILCALLAAIIWNLLTWWFGLPSSSSHALIGGLCGATIASAHGQLSVIKWSVLNPATNKMEGLLPKVILPMLVSPLCGTLFGFAFMGLLILIMRRARPLVVNSIFGKLQIASAAWMSFGHGMNDAQKTMGVIALVLFTATGSGTFDRLPRWLGFLVNPNFEIQTWVKVTCAVVMAAGIATGGWRIIKTMGKKLVRLQPIHGFAAQTTAALVIQVGSIWGMPLSTTHVISTSIMGVGATKRLNAVKWRLMGRIVWAWVLTLPVTAVLGYGLFRLLGVCGMEMPAGEVSHSAR